MPKEKYARAPEILAHSQAIGRKYDLYRGACFQTEVTELRWDEAAARWIVSTNRGDRMRARFVVHAERAAEPAEAARASRASSRSRATRSTPAAGTTPTPAATRTGTSPACADKRVGIIGTGATAVQCVPHLGEAAEHLYVFQRTPSSIDVRANRPTDPEWARALAARLAPAPDGQLQHPGLGRLPGRGPGQRRLDRHHPQAARDGRSSPARTVSPEGLAKTMELADFQKMEQIRARVDAIVEDPATAEALKPWYRQFCKRPCFHDEYLQTFNRPNVTLVDTQGAGRRARDAERASSSSGVEYELDCLIYATGFEVGTDYTRRAGYEIHGRDGLTLTEKWADGVRTLHGMHSRGFPNCFIMGHPAGGLHRELPAHARTSRAGTSPTSSSRRSSAALRTVEVSEAAEAEWVDTIIRLAGFGRRVPRVVHAGLLQQRGQAWRAQRRRTASSAAARRRSSRSCATGAPRASSRGSSCA